MAFKVMIFFLVRVTEEIAFLQKSKFTNVEITPINLVRLAPTELHSCIWKGPRICPRENQARAALGFLILLTFLQLP